MCNLSLLIKPFLAVITCLLLFCPWQEGKEFVFSYAIQDQGKLFLWFLLLWTGIFLVRVSSQKTSVNLNLTDLIFILYIIYLAAITQFHPIPFNPEILFQWTLIGMIYLLSGFLSLQDARFVFWVLLLSALLQSGYGLFYPDNIALYYRFSRLSGIFRNTGLWSCFLMYSFISSCGLVMLYQNSRIRFILIASILIFTLLLWYGNSRAAWLGSIIGTTFLVIRTTGAYLRRISLKCKIIFILIAGCIFSYSLSQVYHYKTESAEGRLLIWSGTIRMIRENPLTGHGIGSFRQQYMKYQASFLKQQTRFDPQLADNVGSPFNEYLRIGTEQGICGLLLCILWLGTPFLGKQKQSATRSENRISGILQSLLIAFAVFSLFSYPSESLPLMAVPIFCTGLLSRNSSPVIRSSKGRLSGSVVIGCMVFAIYLFSYTPYKKTIYKWNSALQQVYDNPEGSIATLEQIAPVLKHTPAFLLNYGLLLNRQQHYREALSVLKNAAAIYPDYGVYLESGKSHAALGDTLQAFQCWQKASGMIPHKFMPFYLQMKVYERNGLQDKAYRMARLLAGKKIKVATPTLNKIIREAESICNNH